MIKIRTIALLTVALLATQIAFAQQDAENIDHARNALDALHKCDEAMRYLNLVSPDNRQSPDYILCMGRTQDCMQNNEQALYYYNKYLALKPANDSVKKRVAELTDQKNKVTHSSAEEHKAKEIYQVASKNRKKRYKNLDDNYYSSGIGYGAGLGGDKCPFKGAMNILVSDGIMVLHNKAVLDINSMTNLLLSPNNTWFFNALQLPAGSVANIDVGTGFAEVFTIGFCPVLINNKDVALTVGGMAGIDFYLFPNTSFDSYTNTSISNKVTFCYGIKSNLYLGDHFMAYINLLLNTANSADVSSGSITGGGTVPANYNMLNIGIALKFDSWW